jgi:hypothetical protein
VAQSSTGQHRLHAEYILRDVLREVSKQFMLYLYQTRGLCLLACASVCSSEKDIPLVRREREAQEPPDWEVAGLLNGRATRLRPYEEEREQSGQPPSTSMRHWYFAHLPFSMARRAGGVGDKPGTLRRAYSGIGYHDTPFPLAGAQGTPRRCDRWQFVRVVHGRKRGRIVLRGRYRAHREKGRL